MTPALVVVGAIVVFVMPVVLFLVCTLTED